MENRCTTLANLKPDIQNWFIKVVVAEKTPIRCSKWGKQQRIVLVDKDNNSMQCIIYEQDVERLDKALQLYNTYFIGNGKIKTTTAGTPTLGSLKYQITLSRSTYIKPTDKHEELSLDHVYQLTPFIDCPQYADSTDRHIRSRPTILTLWEEFLQTEGLRLSVDVHKMPIILGMRLSVNTYHGIYVGTLPGSSILFDPPIPQAQHLESWLKANTEYVERIISEKLYVKENQAKEKPLDSQIRKISQILSLIEMSRVKSFWVIQVIKSGQRFYFLGCSGCSRNCGAAYGSEFTCFYCNNDFPSPKPIQVIVSPLYHPNLDYCTKFLLIYIYIYTHIIFRFRGCIQLRFCWIFLDF